MATILKSVNLPQKGKIEGTQTILKSVSIPYVLYCIQVVDDSLIPVPNADVTILSNTYTTNGNGEINTGVFSGTINISSFGFQDYSAAFTFDGVADGECLVISLTPEICINPVPENTNNFYRFHRLSSDVPISPTIPFCEEEVPSSIPNEFDFSPCEEYYPNLPVEETISVYFNAEETVPYTFANLRLSIVDSSYQILVDNVTALLDDNGRFYFEVEIPVLSEQIVHFLVYDFTLNKARYISNPLQVVESWKGKLSKVSYRHFKRTYYFGYTNLPLFKNIAFLNVSKTNKGYETDIETYQNVAKQRGNHQQGNVIDTRRITLKTIMFDDAAHDAFYVMITQHSSIEINGNELKLEGNYERNQDERMKVSTGEVTMYLQNTDKSGK